MNTTVSAVIEPLTRRKAFATEAVLVKKDAQLQVRI